MKKQEIAVWQVFIRRFSKNFALFALWFRLNPLPKEFATTVLYSTVYCTLQKVGWNNSCGKVI